MGKEVKDRSREIDWPLPGIYVILIALAAFAVSKDFSPPIQKWEEWIQFNRNIIIAVLVLYVPVVGYGWPFHPRCSLSFRFQHRYDFRGTIRIYENPCGRLSIGKIKVLKEKWGVARWKYFCKGCNPQKPYFQYVLRSRYEEVFINSVREFLLVEKDGGEEDERDHHDNADPPDIKIS